MENQLWKLLIVTGRVRNCRHSRGLKVFSLSSGCRCGVVVILGVDCLFRSTVGGLAAALKIVPMLAAGPQHISCITIMKIWYLPIPPSPSLTFDMASLHASKMPGSYFPDFEQSTCPSLHLTTVNARPPLFLPPTSPSATSSLSKSHCSTLQPTSDSVYVSRKRVRRNDHTSGSNPTPPRTSQQTTAWTKIEIPFAQPSATYSPVAESPAAFINTRYRIAGGLDTPSAARLDAEERYEQDMTEVDYRPNRTMFAARRNSASRYPQTPAVAANGGHVGRKRAHSDDRSGWSRTVVNLVGGVAGKVISFCWNSAFRGFQAGGGQAYGMNSDTPALVEQSTWMEIGEKDDVFNQNYEAQHYHQMTPVPGQFPEEGFIHDYMSQPQAYRADQLPTPVPHGVEGTSALRGSWVLLNDEDGIKERDRSPLLSARESPREAAYHAKRPITQPLLRASGNRPRLTPTRPSLAGSTGCNNKGPASFASPRASPGRSGASEADFYPTRSAGHRRSRSSIASPRRTTEVGSKQGFTTPSSPDVQRFEKKIRRKERKEDESIQRLNKQLQDMIKEGKEALGTKFEVEDDPDEDEGQGEGNETMAASKW